MKTVAGAKMLYARKYVAAGAGSVAGMLRGAGDGGGGSWIAECVMHLVGGSTSSSLLLLKTLVPGLHRSSLARQMWRGPITS